MSSELVCKQKLWVMAWPGAVCTLDSQAVPGSPAAEELSLTKQLHPRDAGKVISPSCLFLPLYPTLQQVPGHLLCVW